MATASWRWPRSRPARQIEMAVALIVAAGRGEGPWGRRPQGSVDALRAVPVVRRIVVALPADALDEAPAGTVAVAGGAARSESVRNALAAAGGGDPGVVHAAARP